MTATKGRILIVDDEPSMRTALVILLRRNGFETVQAPDGAEALAILTREPFDMILTDLKMGRMNGMELLRRARRIRPIPEVIILTAYGTVGSAVEAMKLGAYDYIEKPFDDEALLLKMDRALERRHLMAEVRALKAELSGRSREDGIVAKSRRMREVLAMVEQVAPSEATVLIQGESGTGKELIARAIHRLSRRRHHPFIPLDCTALPETLLESELFGYEKGAFTGADRARTGLFEAAHRGSLFLDEIGDMPTALQGKLLRVLQEGEVRRLGSTEAKKIDVRILAATHRPVDAMVSGGDFRQDLFYRLNVVRIRIPALRERTDDIIPLAQHFLERYRHQSIHNTLSFSVPAVEAMIRHPWHGNVRELENSVERAVILTRSAEIDAAALALDASPRPPAGEFETNLKAIQKRHILNVLEQYEGNQLQAAKALGIGRNTLWRWLKNNG